MKISLQRLREIITEELIKEELAPEIAAPAIAAMLQGMEAEATSDIFGDVFTHMYGEAALQAQADAAQPGDFEEEGFPTEYQPGGGEGDRPVMGFKEGISDIIQEEYYLYKIKDHMSAELLTEVRGMNIEDAREIMGKLDADPDDPTVSREDAWDAKMTVREYEQGDYADPAELRQQAMTMADDVITNPMRRTTRQIKQLEDMWRKYKGDLRNAIETIRADNNEEETTVDALASFYDYLTSAGNIQQHDVS